MKKFKFLFSLIITGALFLNGTSAKVFAEENIKDSNIISKTSTYINENNLNKDIKEELNKCELSNFKDELSVKALENLKENAVGFKEKDVYMREVLDNNTGKVELDQQQYTFTEMLDIEMKQAKKFPADTENSWIRLSMQIYKMSNGKYEFYLFYDWKTRPFFKLNDIIAIGHDSNIYFDTQTARSFHEQVLLLPGIDTPAESIQNISYSDTSKCKSSINGVGFKFNLTDAPDNSIGYWQGYMTVQGGFNNTNNTSGSMEICYSHQQLSFSYNIQDAIEFLTTGNVKIKITGSQDDFKYGDVFYKF